MSVLCYGAYGFTGQLIAAEAVERGLDPILAGRSEPKAARVGRQLGCEWRAFDLETPPVEHLDDVDVVLNCAGPFVDTTPALVDACLDAGAHYLDITGEIEVFEALAERDREAERAGICLLPGVGFDVVPTDCLAARLHRRLPEGDRLRLAIDYRGPISGGTFRTLLEHIDDGGYLRRDGELVSVPAGWDRRLIDFGHGPQTAVSAPIGDVSTAFYTTGIRTIEGYVSVPPAGAQAMRLGATLSPILGAWPVKRGLQSLASVLAPGPDEQARERNVARVWGEVTDGDQTVEERLRTPEPYALTVDAATSAVERILADAPTGFETPSAALGDGFALSLDRVELIEG